MIQITTVLLSIQTNFPFLRKINLQNNQIQSLDNFKEFITGPKHEFEPNYLNVQDNKITSLPEWLYETTLETDLMLSGNPFDCSCDAVRKFSKFHQVYTTKYRS